MLEKFKNISKEFLLERINILTERGNINDFIELRGPNLAMNIMEEQTNQRFVLCITDKIGLKLEVPCEGVEIIEEQKDHNGLVTQINVYVFVQDGFFTLKLYGNFKIQPSSTMKERFYENLVEEAINCRICPRLKDKRAVIGAGCGNIHADIMFIGEAPGPNGADITGIPFHGDPSGDNFESLLESIHLSRDDVYVTNAVLCCPTDSNNRVVSPISQELGNCRSFLLRQIEMVNPKVIVTMGTAALNALKKIQKHNFILSECVAQAKEWNGYTLFPLYHTSPKVRSLGIRTEKQQQEDFKKLFFLSEFGVGEI